MCFCHTSPRSIMVGNMDNPLDIHWVKKKLGLSTGWSQRHWSLTQCSQCVVEWYYIITSTSALLAHWSIISLLSLKPLPRSITVGNRDGQWPTAQLWMALFRHHLTLITFVCLITDNSCTQHYVGTQTYAILLHSIIQKGVTKRVVHFYQTPHGQLAQ